MTPLARWTPTLASTRALAVRQPWAWLIVNGRKDVENRSRRTKIRGTILIHASAATSQFARLRAEVRERLRCRIPADVEYGGIVGAVDIVDCLETSGSPWHEAGYFRLGAAQSTAASVPAMQGVAWLFHTDLRGVRLP